MFSSDVRVEKEETVVEDGKVFVVRTMYDTKKDERYVVRRRDRNDALQEINRKNARKQRSEWTRAKGSELQRLKRDMEKALGRLERRAVMVKQRANAAAEDVLQEHERLRTLLERKQKEAMQKINLRKREQLHNLKQTHTQVRQNYSIDMKAIEAQFERVYEDIHRAEQRGQKVQDDIMKWPQRAIDAVSIPDGTNSSGSSKGAEGRQRRRSTNKSSADTDSRAPRNTLSNNTNSEQGNGRPRNTISNNTGSEYRSNSGQTLSSDQGTEQGKGAADATLPPRHSRTSVPPEPESAPSVPEVPPQPKLSLSDVKTHEALRYADATPRSQAGFEPEEPAEPEEGMQRGQTVEVSTPGEGSDNAWVSGKVVGTRDGDIQVEYRRAGDATNTSTREWLATSSPRLRVAEVVAGEGLSN